MRICYWCRNWFNDNSQVDDLAYNHQLIDIDVDEPPGLPQVTNHGQPGGSDSTVQEDIEKLKRDVKGLIEVIDMHRQHIAVLERRMKNLEEP